MPCYLTSNFAPNTRSHFSLTWHSRQQPQEQRTCGRSLGNGLFPLAALSKSQPAFCVSLSPSKIKIPRGRGAGTIPGHAEKCSASARNPVRPQPGIVFGISPERCSPSPRNPVRLRPESARKQPATSSLGSRTYVQSKTLARFCGEFLNLQHLAKSTSHKSVGLFETRMRQGCCAGIGLLVEGSVGN